MSWTRKADIRKASHEHITDCLPLTQCTMLEASFVQAKEDGHIGTNNANDNICGKVSRACN